MKYIELLLSDIDTEFVEAVNKILRECVHSESRKHTVQSFVDCCRDTTVFIATPTGEKADMVGFGVIASKNLPTHVSLDIHNLAVCRDHDQTIAHGLIEAMVKFAQANFPPEQTIQITVKIASGRDGLGAFVESLGFRPYAIQFRIPAPRKPKKK